MPLAPPVTMADLPLSLPAMFGSLSQLVLLAEGCGCVQRVEILEVFAQFAVAKTQDKAIVVGVVAAIQEFGR
jgi:hypothetical protein